MNGGRERMYERMVDTATDEFRTWLSGCHLIIADSVFKRYFQIGMSGKWSVFHPSHLGRISKPFDLLWIDVDIGRLVDVEEDGRFHVIASYEDDDSGRYRWCITLVARFWGMPPSAATKIYVDEHGRFTALERSGGLLESEFDPDLWWNGVIFPTLATISYSQEGSQFIRLRKPQRRHGLRVTRGGRLLPNYREVLLPKQFRIYDTDTHDKRETPAQHWVCGHWKPSINDWIAPYLRGDPAKGFVTTAYRTR